MLNNDVRKFGKMLKSFVKFFFAFLLFSLFNLCLDLFTKHTHLLSVETFRLLEQGLRVFVNQNLITFVSILSEHNLFAALAIVFVCAFEVTVVVHALATVKATHESDGSVTQHKQTEQECVVASCTVAYKQKVCFLS